MRNVLCRRKGKGDKNQYKVGVRGEKANRVENTEWRVQLWDEERVK